MRKFCVLFFLFAACTRPDMGTNQTAVTQDPEKVVRSFIQLSASSESTEDRRKLQDLCIGELKRAFERMSNDEFRLAYVDSHIKLEDLKILDASTKNDVTLIHYQVTIENPGGTDRTKETNEREVELRLSQGAWYIEFIRTKGSDKLAFTRGMIF